MASYSLCIDCLNFNIGQSRTLFRGLGLDEKKKKKTKTDVDMNLVMLDKSLLIVWYACCDQGPCLRFGD
jgi:hypothetical protein